MVVAAWGAHKLAVKRGVDVMNMLKKAGVAVNCLGTTKHGHPLHPLYQRKDLQPQPYPGEKSI